MKSKWPIKPVSALRRAQDSNLCWWCGGNADSREHRIKRSDVMREGAGKIDPDNLLISRARIREHARGPNSDLLKFKGLMCASCNNARSQPFDKAQERLTGYYRAHEATIVTTKRLPVRTIFPSNSVEQTESLRRYFVKFVGCFVRDMGFDVTHNIRTYLDSTNPLCDVDFSLHVCPQTFEIQSKYPPETPGLLGHSDARSLRAPLSNECFQISGVWVYRSLQVHWKFRAAMSVPLDNPFCDDIGLEVDDFVPIPTHFGPVPQRSNRSGNSTQKNTQ